MKQVGLPVKCHFRKRSKKLEIGDLIAFVSSKQLKFIMLFLIIGLSSVIFLWLFLSFKFSITPITEKSKY